MMATKKPGGERPFSNKPCSKRQEQDCNLSNSLAKGVYGTPAT